MDKQAYYDAIDGKTAAMAAAEDKLAAAIGTDGEQAAREALMDAIKDLNATMAVKDVPYEWKDPVEDDGLSEWIN